VSKLPKRIDRLAPDKLGRLFHFLPAEYADPAHPGIPLNAEGRRRKLETMSAKEMRQSYNQARAEDALIYEKATGYGIKERVPFKHAVLLMTGAWRPSTAVARIRSWLAFGIEEDESGRRHQYKTGQINQLLAGWRFRGLSAEELTVWAHSFSEARTAKAAQACRKNLVSARKKRHRPKKRLDVTRCTGRAH
jgi:hypothetical protein